MEKNVKEEYVFILQKVVFSSWNDMIERACPDTPPNDAVLNFPIANHSYPIIVDPVKIIFLQCETGDRDQSLVADMNKYASSKGLIHTRPEHIYSFIRHLGGGCGKFPINLAICIASTTEYYHLGISRQFGARIQGLKRIANIHDSFSLSGVGTYYAYMESIRQ